MRVFICTFPSGICVFFVRAFRKESSPVCARARHHLSDHHRSLPSRPRSRAQQHVNGGEKRPSCDRGEGGAPILRSRHSHAPHAHPEPEPHPHSPSDTQHPEAGSPGSRSHEESQPQSLQRCLAHAAPEVRLSPDAQPLSHDQGREGGAGLRREAPQANGTSVPQNSSAGKICSFLLFFCEPYIWTFAVKSGTGSG